MISKTLQIAILLAVAVYFFLLLHLLKRQRLNLKYTLLWLFSGIVMLLLALFPQALHWFSRVVGIYDPTNALFAVVFFCVICILMSLTAIVSKQNQNIKRLVQANALLEKQIRDLDEKAGISAGQTQKDQQTDA